MAKITRKNQLIFASDAGGTGITEYGSPAGGTPAFSTDPDDIQTPAWGDGWAAAALAGTEIPTFQDFNAIHFVSTRQIAYLLQEGVAEFASDAIYYTNSIVKKTGTYELYGSKINDNTGNALPVQTDDSNWQYLGDLSELVNITSVDPGIAVAWVNFTGTGTVTINQEHNVSSITDNSTGNYTINLSVTLADAESCFVTTKGRDIAAQPNPSPAIDTYPSTTTSFKVYTSNNANSPEDYSRVYAAVFGELA